MIKVLHAQLKKMNIVSLLCFLAVVFGVMWLLDHLPEIIRFLYTLFITQNKKP
jgi:hypothetical protein